MKRSGKWYRRNERDVMEMLGMEPTPNSGSGWVVKEDGQNDHVVCQLKSTDANSIRINKKDIDTLEHNAAVEHKVPVFAIQFINAGQVYLVIKPSAIGDVQRYLKTGKNETQDFLGIDEMELEPVQTCRTSTIRSSSEARLQFEEDRKNKYKKVRSAK